MIISKYEIGKEIGSGSFGTVNLAHDRNTGEKVAVKCISKTKLQRSNMGSQVKKEIMAMKKLHHPNIVRIHEVLMSNSHLYLVLEYAAGGELFSIIARQGKLSEHVSKKYFSQIMEAVRYCHNLYVCHRDIKPENILLAADDSVKIADFGFASIMEPEEGSQYELLDEERRPRLSSIEENSDNLSTIKPLRDFNPDTNPSLPPKPQKFKNLPSKIMQKMSTMCGTTQYMAPEIVSRDSYRGDKVDIWSCGIVLFVLVTGYLPFDSQHPETVMQKIKTRSFTIPPFVSELTRDLIDKMLTLNPLFRPGARTILNHKWFRDITKQRPITFPTTNTETLPACKNKPSLASKQEKQRLLTREERRAVLNIGIKEAISSVVGILKTSAWMHKVDGDTGTAAVKGSQMTPTGLAMIQVVFHRHETSDAMTVVEVEVFGKQQNSGAHEINKLVNDIKGFCHNDDSIKSS